MPRRLLLIPAVMFHLRPVYLQWSVQEKLFLINNWPIYQDTEDKRSQETVAPVDVKVKYFLTARTGYLSSCTVISTTVMNKNLLQYVDQVCNLLLNNSFRGGGPRDQTNAKKIKTVINVKWKQCLFTCVDDELAMLQDNFLDETTHEHAQHENFFASLRDRLVGRKTLLKKAFETLKKTSSGLVMVYGKPGSGKSSVMVSRVLYGICI